jgi:DNA-binding NarL/FixJ family response regulator
LEDNEYRGPISVLIADDHTIARKGLRAMLETYPRIEIVGEADDGEAAVVAARALRPRVVLMDVRMPRLDGLAATRIIKAEVPTTTVIVITSHEDPALVVGAVQAGASGYLLKDATADLLSRTVSAVASGGILIDASLLRRALGRVSTEASRNASVADERSPRDYQPLSPRETTALKLLAEGLSNREIGDRMGFAEPTIKKMVQSIIAKLRASDRTHAAIKALRLGLID